MPADRGHRRWWEGATFYQVYVRSWLDTNADGYGDLPGVTARLDYLSWLGVTGLWLSPTMPSPDEDWGYDVCDYYGVHPDLGTLDDLDTLIAEAASRDIKVLLDLAPNHTSRAHPWFAAAVSGPGAAQRHRYVWADPAPGGGPPNNWLDATGESAWARDPASGQYYLHSFLPSMPDLNWWDPAVHDAFADILRYWFGRGVAGVRVDSAHGLYHDAALRDDPPARDGGRLHSPHGLEQAYSANRPETHAVYRQWRRLADSYSPPRLLLGETWVADLDRMAAYHGSGDELQLTFNFPFIFADFTAAALSRVVAETLAVLPAGACPVWTASNHDISRFPSRWCGGDEGKARLALLVLSMLPGTLVLYYGDEIGMTDLAVPPALRRDQMTAGDEGRDHARTPMQWDASPSAGFTAAGVRPWLPYGDNAARHVAAQRADPGSMLRLCRDLIALRSAESGGRVTSYRQLPGPPQVWVYQAGDLVVTANFADQPARLDSCPGPVVASSAGPDALRGQTLAPWAGVITRNQAAG
jgi:alpha-glucosidase